MAAWVEAVQKHQPGVLDAQARTIAEWPWAKLKPVLNTVWHQGDVLLILRGATLHADISAVTPPDAVPSAPTGGHGILAIDGRQVGFAELDSHIWWGRRLLDRITPHHVEWERLRPVIVLWYRSVAATLAARNWLADLEPHLARAVERFPDDPGILFDAGCMAESLAAPFVQATIAPKEARPSRMSAIASLQRYRTSPLVYLTTAERHFRRAVEQDASFAEARIRLGRIISVRRKHDEAIVELSGALTLAATPVVRYYNQMFLGRALQNAGRPAEARAAYERAATLFPQAPSPHLEIASAASGNADKASARAAIDRVLELSPDQDHGGEPWWEYHRCTGRNADSVYAAMVREMEKLK
jgi:tetratricopeptide (TPR) repeat protein